MTLLVFLWALLAAQKPADQPIGMVLQVQGEARIHHRNGAAAAARIADFLYSGDRITTGFGRTTLLSCPLPETITLKEDTEIELGGEQIKTIRGQILSRTKVEVCPLLRTALGAESLERVGGLRGRGYPPIPIYLGGPVSTGHPLFEWASVPEARTYLMTLRNSSGLGIWDEVAVATGTRYPTSRTALEPGSYQWEVRARKGDGTVIAAQIGTFEVKPWTNALVSAADSPRALRAAAFEQAGYHAEAAREFRALLQENPTDERIIRHLAWLYWNAGLIIAFNEEMQRIKP